MAEQRIATRRWRAATKSTWNLMLLTEERAAPKDASELIDPTIRTADLAAGVKGIRHIAEALMSKPLPPHPKTVFDEEEFLRNLAYAVSLSTGEKMLFAEHISIFTQEQMDLLCAILRDEAVALENLARAVAERAVQEAEADPDETP
jgi:hypothetical protein